MNLSFMSPSPPATSALRLGLAGPIMFLALNFACADTRYISDQQRVPLRASPCDTCTIIHEGLVSGTRLVLQESEEGWARVSTESGLNGWLPDEALVSVQPAGERLAIAEASLQSLRKENTFLKTRIAELEAEVPDPSTLALHNAELEAELATLRKSSLNVSVLQEQNESLIKENRMLQSEIDVLTATRDQLMNDNTHKWFVYGGIAVFLGALLAVLIPRLRPRRRFTEWG